MNAWPFAFFFSLVRLGHAPRPWGFLGVQLLSVPNMLDQLA